MTNSHREDDLEIIKQLLISTARRTESTDERLSELVRIQDITQRQLDGLAVKVEILSEKVDNVCEKVDTVVIKLDKVNDKLDGLCDKVDDFIQVSNARDSILNNVIIRLDESNARLEANQNATNTRIDRLESILDEMRRNNQSHL